MLIKSALESFAKYFTMAHFSIHVFFYAGVQVTRQKKVVTMWQPWYMDSILFLMMICILIWWWMKWLCQRCRWQNDWKRHKLQWWKQRTEWWCWWPLLSHLDFCIYPVMAIFSLDLLLLFLLPSWILYLPCIKVNRCINGYWLIRNEQI